MLSLPALGMIMGLQIGHRGTLLCCLIGLVAAAWAEPEPAQRYLRSRGRENVAKKKTTLLTKGPGFWRGEGVRGGVQEESLGRLGDAGGGDQTLKGNPFEDGMAGRFTMLDNLEPTAPMDRLHAALGEDSEPGHFMDPVYVPEYLNPDGFPTVAGKGCMCSMPNDKNKKIACSCGKKDDKDHYTWLKESPVLGTSNFTLQPADITYPSGNYWGPKTRDGLVAPMDTLPTDRYPLQAKSEKIWPLPASAQEDRIPVRYARYMDQVQDRTLECDTVSKRCVVECKPGDEVVATIGNTVFNAKVVKTFEGNAAQIQFTPSLAEGKDAATEECPMAAACSAFRYCKGSDQHCTHVKDQDSRNWAGRLIRKHTCPEGTKACKVVNQVVMATMLKKGDKACKAAAR